MKMLYNEYFHVPEDGKVREKVLITRVAFTVVVILLCLAAISFTAYAHFSGSISSASNVIRAANYDLKLTVTEGEPLQNAEAAKAAESEKAETEEIVFTKNKKGEYTKKLEAGSYRVTLSAAGTAENGFAIVTVGDEPSYHTAQIKKGGPFSFCLQINGEAVVSILPHWGTSSHYAYSNTNNPYYITETNNLIQVDIAKTGKFDLTEDTDPEEETDEEESSQEEEPSQEESSKEESGEVTESSPESSTESSAESSAAESSAESSKEESEEASQEETSTEEGDVAE